METFFTVSNTKLSLAIITICGPKSNGSNVEDEFHRYGYQTKCLTKKLQDIQLVLASLPELTKGITLYKWTRQCWVLLCLLLKNMKRVCVHDDLSRETDYWPIYLSAPPKWSNFKGYIDTDRRWLMLSWGQYSSVHMVPRQVQNSRHTGWRWACACYGPSMF